MIRRILVVDDEVGILKAFTHILKRAGYEVATATGYKEAVAALDEGGLDLVLTDIMLKGRSGVEVLSACRTSDRTLPVVMITGQPTVETASQAVRLGAFDYVSKPVQRETLLAVARRAIQHGELVRNKEQLEAQLREREENFSALFNAITECAVLLDTEGLTLAINEVGAQRMGMLVKDVVGRRMEELFDPESVAARMGQMARVMETGSPLRFEDTRDEHILDMTFYPVFGDSDEVERIAVFSRDITETRRSEEALRRVEREKERIQQGLEAVFRSIPEAIFTVGEDLVVRQANHGVAALSGPTYPVAQGQALSGPESTLAGECAKLARYTLSTNKPVKEYRLTLNVEDRELVAVINTAPLLDEQRMPIGAVLAVRDITRLANLEERLRERQGYGEIVGRSEPMQEVYERIGQLAGVDSTVLIIGESGTGKELVANAIGNPPGI